MFLLNRYKSGTQSLWKTLKSFSDAGGKCYLTGMWQGPSPAITHDMKPQSMVVHALGRAISLVGMSPATFPVLFLPQQVIIGIESTMTVSSWQSPGLNALNNCEVSLATAPPVQTVIECLV